MSGSLMLAACEVCDQVKPGRMLDLPLNAPGAVVVSAGHPPVAFVCLECEDRQKRGLEALVRGQRVETFVENDWIPGHFERPGDPGEARLMQDDRVVGGTYLRDVAFVRGSDTGNVESFWYSQLRIPA